MQDELEFRFRGGRLSLDFAATLGGRYRGGIERLGTPPDLDRWIRLAIGDEVGPAATGPDLGAARELRETIYRLVHPASRDEPLPADVELVNSWAGRPDFAPSLGLDARSVRRRAEAPVEAGLATVARDAIELLAGAWRDLVRECGAPGCSLLFVDASRPGQRQWCDMGTCGNRMKARRYRTSHRAPARPATEVSGSAGQRSD